MVCTLGGGRMSAMARLLGTGNDLEMRPDLVGHEKLAAQSIGWDLCKADELNLLDEEDMHIYDCRPMVDILHLVRCNNCKKPVKASQYTAHWERCRSLKCTFMELGGGGKGHKKPPRKGKKKSQPVGEGPVGSTNGDDTSCPTSVAQTGMATTTLSQQAKRNSASCVGVAAAAVNSGSEKRTKLPKAPSPLATKMYHSQRNLRTRFALNHLYHQTSSSTRDHCYSYTNYTPNSGSSLGNIQQPSGSVHVA